MNRTTYILGLGIGAALMMPAMGLAASDSYDAGFYTRGIEAATYMDQGGAILDPFYFPVKDVSVLPRVTLAVNHEDNIFLSPDDPQAGTSVWLTPGLLVLWGRPVDNHVYVDYGASLPIYESEDDLDDKPSHLLRLGTVYRTGKSQLNGQVGYRRLEEADITLGERIVKQDLFGDLSVEYRISGKSSAGVLGGAP